jgi:hypothetical protein
MECIAKGPRKEWALALILTSKIGKIDRTNAAFLARIIPCIWGTVSREGLEIDRSSTKQNWGGSTARTRAFKDWQSIGRMNDGYTFEDHALKSFEYLPSPFLPMILLLDSGSSWLEGPICIEVQMTLLHDLFNPFHFIYSSLGHLRDLLVHLTLNLGKSKIPWL